MTAAAVDFGDIERAAARLKGVVRRTPLLESPLLNAEVGARLLVKAEPLQITGSFKLRGAYNKIADTDAKEIVAYSSGNHAQGVAYAAKRLGRRATILMPGDAPAIKRANTAAYGADVRIYDRTRESREAIGEAIAAERGAVLVRPYDDPRVIAGQGTVGLEMAAACRDLGVEPDVALCCCGGGGLIAGVGTALKAALPKLAVYAVEPAGYDDTKRSLEAGERRSVEGHPPSFCDAILTREPGEITFPINRANLAGGLAVDDAQVADAMRRAFHHFKLVIEPGGAVALAAALSGEIDLAGKTVLVVASGGNVDPDLFAAVLAGG